MTGYVWLNDSIVRWSEANVHVFSYSELISLNEGRVGPFIAGLYTAAIRRAEVAIKIKKENEGKLTPEDIAYLKHVIREGKITKKFLEKHGVHVKSPLLDSYQLDEDIDQSSTVGQS